MKTKYLFLALFLTTVFNYAQEFSLDFKEYSYAQFFEMIEKEKDTVFKLNNAFIKVNEKTDQEYSYKLNINTNEIVDIDSAQRKIIGKHIALNNVHFQKLIYKRIDDNISYYYGGLVNIHFTKSFNIVNTASFFLYNSTIDDEFRSTNFDVCKIPLDTLRNNEIYRDFEIHHSKFNKSFLLTKNCVDRNILDINIEISNSVFSLEGTKNQWQEFLLFVRNSGWVSFNNNIIQTKNIALISLGECYGLKFRNNTISSLETELNIREAKTTVEILENAFSDNISVNIDQLKPQDQIEWSQFKGIMVSSNAKRNYILRLADKNKSFNDSRKKEFHNMYKDSLRLYDKTNYGNELALMGTFYNHYRSKYDLEAANEVYLELKDFETKRLKILYEQSPSFKTFFKWKVNQFLKLFSDYGTEPSKAIVFSVYVIFLFGIIYLFFPNSWDVHGKRRIIDRYSFFFKYMNKNAGIHEVYLEDKKNAILEFEDFKSLIEQQGKSVPIFFSLTALPLYKWAVSGTKLSASLLKQVDILKGTWHELPQHQRFWKSILLTGAFLVALIYDLFIKVLNSLMLSINTFTTLGFGEIPIKGFPRYLAIVQGFIGWFMLTIFSVSLISQLLN